MGKVRSFRTKQYKRWGTQLLLGVPVSQSVPQRFPRLVDFRVVLWKPIVPSEIEMLVLAVSCCVSDCRGCRLC